LAADLSPIASTAAANLQLISLTRTARVFFFKPSDRSRHAPSIWIELNVLRKEPNLAARCTRECLLLHDCGLHPGMNVIEAVTSAWSFDVSVLQNRISFPSHRSDVAPSLLPLLYF
jgi:hypothetical protein